MNLSPTCEAQLGEAWTRLSRLGQLAAHRGERVALVGGVVRDLLLNEAPSGDFDLAVEGDAIGLAQAWSDKEGGTLHKHQPFQNASWSLHGTQFDLVRARREHYPGVAQLPEVTPASLEEDLGRRPRGAGLLRGAGLRRDEGGKRRDEAAAWLARVRCRGVDEAAARAGEGGRGGVVALVVREDGLRARARAEEIVGAVDGLGEVGVGVR